MPLVLLGVVVVLVVPGAFDGAGRAVGAHLVAFRMPVALGVLVLGVAVLLVPRARRSPVGAASAAVLLVGAAAQLGVLAARGWDGDATAAREDGDVVVLAFNTLGVVTSEDLAPLVLEHRADVVVLPETLPATARATAALLEDAGRPVWVFGRSTEGSTPVASTALLVTTDLGRYEVTAELPTMLGGFRADPVAGATASARGAHAGAAGRAPLVVAAHPTAPFSLAAMDDWRRETSLVAQTCGGTSGAVVAGDLNATLDHPGLRDLGSCVDAAEAAGAAALGTWPAAMPSWLSTPIDHVLVDPEVWDVVGFDVLPAVGGSDHRPVVAHLRPR
ncbi:endonuclease/exonuclease/phosphatase family protein [Cellulomonas cellasea]|uniref:Endonuclease/exonuclease/phosphatase (EEP) superfamily protein YafD n=1 Tax=Cellulomonas cellasea TaxID=43670 RepID=A0A7W4Y9E5_9CELL|nr:endonuclease/exonuclease/phosphatase family protein [Cellulomonas cellasea]MBB2921503.1 endonuclease/exonuclease/phosphatase (EEP) superfamily protein YafD [Cellulomonas cellasea]